ncbi:MAG: Bax inhibitor-1/YccA family protein [Candidatus Roseilinea sp.]|uniref:Bax inhibitor-1/YccA family protein n=1 Tax=Candidatus Roseilinea sp. TaxID=2838777 RepID=UPI00404B7D7F
MNQFDMNRPMGSTSSIAVDQAAERSFITKVYGWMALALSITGLVAAATAQNPAYLEPLLSGPGTLILIFGQLGLVIVLSLLIRRLSAVMATVLFLIYSITVGITFSFLFYVYTAESIGQVFFITAGTFALVSAYGYATKRDLTSLGSLGVMALIGLILGSIVNLFLQSEGLMWALTYIGVLVFVGLIAYDTQRIKRMAHGIGEDGEVQRKAAIIGALALYLDFINLFIRLLRIFGRRR